MALNINQILAASFNAVLAEARKPTNNWAESALMRELDRQGAIVKTNLGVTIQADIIKQKLPENNGGFKALNTGSSSYGKLDERIYTELTTDHPIDLCRYQVANCYMGRAGLINSGGASGKHDFEDAAFTAVVNKRAGGTGLISGRKAFQRPMQDGIKLLNTIQDVYLCNEITVA